MKRFITVIIAIILVFTMVGCDEESTGGSKLDTQNTISAANKL